MILKKEGQGRSGIFINTFRLIFKHFFLLFLGQCLLILLALFMLIPFLHSLFDTARSFAGFSYITLNNMLVFLLHPFSILVVILSFFVIGIFFLFEGVYFTSFYSIIENGNSPRLYRVFFLSAKRLILSLLRRNYQLFPFIWIFVLLCNFPLLLFIADNVNVFRYLSGFIHEIRIVVPFFALLFLGLFYLIFRNIFLLHYCMYEGRPFRTAGRLSRKIKKGRTFRTLSYFIVWNVGIGIFTYAIYMAAVAAAAFLTICFTEKSLAVATFISINEKMSNYLALVIFSISLAANFALVTHLFFEYKKENNEYFYFDNSVESIFLKLRSYKRIFAFLGIGFVVLNIILAYNILRNDTPLVYVDFDTIKITSHRGFSRGVPENTLPAIEKAIEEKADYVEMDVRQTKDRKLVLLHDENVRRTTGINKNIGNMTYDEVILLDAGKWVSEEYAGTRIPTLEEALETCKGKINMNLDLKEDRNAVGLEESVVGFINQYEMENQCVITSTSRTILENVKKLNPNIRTGYITYQIQRSDFKNSTIDFFSINSCFASENLLQSVHEEGKEVLVWTVNTKSELERMKNLGVDNIITDDPSYAKEVLFENGNGSSFLKLLRTMMAY